MPIIEPVPSKDAGINEIVRHRPLPFGIEPPAEPTWPVERNADGSLTPGQVIAAYRKTHPYSTGKAKVSSGGAWWNPVTWWNDLSKTAVQGFDDLTHWILVAVKDAANLIWESLHDVWHLATRYSRDIFHWAEECLIAAETLIRRVWHDAIHLLDELRHDVSHWLDDLRHGIAAGFQTIRRLVAETFQRALKDAWLFLERHVFHPLDVAFHFVEHALDWFWHEVNKAWDIFYRDFIHPLVRDFKALVHRVENLESHVFGDIAMWVRELERAADWILWFAEHSFHDIEELAKAGGSDIEKWLKSPIPGE